MSLTRLAILSSVAGVLLMAVLKFPAVTALDANSDQPTFDIWIKDGTIVDGSGQDRYKADLLILGDTIVFVGQVQDGVTARHVLDASGKIVTPGFIDTHAHGDPTTQSFDNFLMQGITTVVIGQDGRSAGVDDEFDNEDDTVGNVETDGQANLTPSLGTVAEWMELVERRGAAVNVIGLSGHGTVREKAGVGSSPTPTADQLAIMQRILRADLEAGAFGLSLGLEYDPGRYSTLLELKSLGRVVREYDGVVMCHLRSENSGEILAAIEELLAIDSHVHIAHLKIVAGTEITEAERVLENLTGAQEDERKVTADVYPYLASASNLVFLYPEWARAPESYSKAVSTRREELAAHIAERVEERLGPEAILIVDGKHAGKRLSQIAEEQDLSYVDVIIDELGYGGPQQAHFLMTADVHNKFVRSDHTSISTDGMPGLRHPRSVSSTVKVLVDHVGAPPRMTLEKAVYKMSGLPATEILKLRNRGLLTEGAKADIVLISFDGLAERADWSKPEEPPTGIDAVIVNGQILVERGQRRPGMSGKLIRSRK